MHSSIRCLTCATTGPHAGHTWSDAQVLIHTVTDSLAEVEAETLGDALSVSQALVETLADRVAEVEA